MNTIPQPVKSILDTARGNAYRALDSAITEACWQTGHTIVNEEQQGQHRTECGAGLLHYRLPARVDSGKARLWYMNKAAGQNWSSRALDRQISTLHCDRSLATRETNQPALETEARQNRMCEALRKLPGDNPTVSLILCSYNEETVVKYSVLYGSEHLSASQYKLFLPTEAELKAERAPFMIRQTRQIL